MKKKEYLILGIILIIVAIIVLIIGKVKEKRCTVEAQATIVEVKQKIDYDTEKSTTTYSYYPVLEYKIKEKTVRKNCKYLERDYNTFKKGEVINILYNPNNIEEYVIPKNNVIVYAAFFVFGFGTIAIICGLFKEDSLIYY